MRFFLFSGYRLQIRMLLSLLRRPYLPSISETGFRPYLRQHQCSAQYAPPIASATAHTFISGLRPTRPRLFRLSGEGKSFSFTSHPLQYTPSWLCGRYQRQPQLSQIFKCTRISMTNSPRGPNPQLFALILRGDENPARQCRSLVPCCVLAALVLSLLVMSRARRSWNHLAHARAADRLRSATH